MVREDVVVPHGNDDWPFTDPRPFWQAGLISLGIAFLLYPLPIWIFHLTGLNLGAFALTGAGWIVLRLLFLAVGILAVAAAVVTRPKSPLVLGLAAGAALVAGWSMDPAWDSARLVMGLLVFLALLALFLVLLPMLMGKVFAGWEFLFSGHREPDIDSAEARGRFAGWVLSRVAVVAIVFFHFVGIASAIMAVAPPARDPSWLFNQVFTAYQPYLQFLYLNNAYRFYSPEPGPPSLLWFHIQYSDGSTRWLKIPTHQEHIKDPLAQEFTRRLSIGESVNQILPMPGIPEATREARMGAGLRDGIPPHPTLGLEAQYRLPAESCRRLLCEYARFVAQHFPSETDPDLEVKSVKVYRIMHGMLTPGELAEEGPARQKPTDPWTYVPYFQGEFDKDGKLLDPKDPYLYWAIPIYRWPKGMKVNPLAGNMPASLSGEYEVHDFLETHARRGLNQ